MSMLSVTPPAYSLSIWRNIMHATYYIGVTISYHLCIFSLSVTRLLPMFTEQVFQLSPPNFSLFFIILSNTKIYSPPGVHILSNTGRLDWNAFVVNVRRCSSSANCPAVGACLNLCIGSCGPDAPIR